MGKINKLILQKEPHHCAVAALAMITGEDYDKIIAQLGATLRDDAGVNEMYVRQYLWDCGYSLRQLYERNLTTNFGCWLIWPPAPFAPVHIAYIRPHHWVAVDGSGAVWDPAGLNDRKLSEYSVYSIIGIFAKEP